MDIRDLLLDTLVEWRCAEMSEANHFLRHGQFPKNPKSEAWMQLARIITDYARGYGPIKDEKELTETITRFKHNSGIS